MEEDRKIPEELLLSFHSQFAENQNHHQKLLVQFISAIAIVVVGYAVVYSNIATNAHLIDSLRDKDEKIISYSISLFVFSYLLAQAILSLIISININIGYGFRRDQGVNYRIRTKYFEPAVYNDIFGEHAFNPTGKDLSEYLPNFNKIFYKFTVSIQILILLSVLFILPFFDNIPKSYMTWWVFPPAVLILSGPLLFDGYFFEHFYEKYKKNVCGEADFTMADFLKKRINGRLNVREKAGRYSGSG